LTASLPRRVVAEAAGTALLVGIGTGAIVAASRAGGVSQAWLAVAWFVAVAVPIFLFARLSGSHINPVVTLALAIARRFPLRELPAYVGAQLVGAFAGSFFVRVTLGNEAHLGATLPAGGDLGLTFLLEFVFTCLLILSVLWLTSEGTTVRWWDLLLPPLVVGVSTFLIGPWTGSSLNPARTLAPGLLSGDVVGLWVYLVSVPLGSLSAVGLLRASQMRTRRSQGNARRADPGR
jgi:aquaporin Z